MGETVIGSGRAKFALDYENNTARSLSRSTDTTLDASRPAILNCQVILVPLSGDRTLEISAYEDMVACVEACRCAGVRVSVSSPAIQVATAVENARGAT